MCGYNFCSFFVSYFDADESLKSKNIAHFPYLNADRVRLGHSSLKGVSGFWFAAVLPRRSRKVTINTRIMAWTTRRIASRVCAFRNTTAPMPREIDKR